MLGREHGSAVTWDRIEESWRSIFDEPKSRPRVLVNGVGFPKGKPMGTSEPEESTRCRLRASSVGEVGKSEPEEKEDRGLIGGVRSDGRRRESALKLNFMLKISLGRRFLRILATHPVVFAVVLVLDAGFVSAADLGERLGGGIGSSWLVILVDVAGVNGVTSRSVSLSGLLFAYVVCMGAALSLDNS